ncbi:MAG: hypothetical protein IIT33_05700 [Prevotella sp.]|jgi:hypothetical protein|nr:hypothetical protein [Prevotella sp.]
MGKIKQGILGGFKGKVGTVIGSSWNGIAYMRGLAQSVKNPKTAGQTTQRGFFREVLDIAGQLSKEQLAFLFPTAPSKMTRHNALVKQLTEVAAVDGDVKSVDLGNINSLGNAATADLPDVAITAAGENLTISWDGATTERAENADEYPTVFVANVTKKKVFLVNSTAALGESGEVSFNVGLAAYGEATDTFSGFMMLTGSKIVLVGFGTMAVTKRPARPKKRD